MNSNSLSKSHVDQSTFAEKILKNQVPPNTSGTYHSSTVAKMVILESTPSSAKTVRKENSVARIVGAGSAGILELALFHPVNSLNQGLLICAG